MATIALYANKLNQMPGLIQDVKKSVANYKAELSALKNKSLKINQSICNTDDVISSIQSSSQTQEEKITSLEAFQQSSEQFIEDTARIDSEVADVVRQRKNDFYEQYNYLKPESEKSWIENKLDKAGEWCKKHLVMIVTAFVVVVIACVAAFCGVAVAAIAAIAGIVSLVLCIADIICIIATGGKSISDVCRDKGMGWLGEIFDGLSLGCDIVSIFLPLRVAFKTMARMGVRSFIKGFWQATKVKLKEIWKKVFKSGFKNGIKNLGQILFKTFIFDIDDFSRVDSTGKRVFDIMDHTPKPDILENTVIVNEGYTLGGKLDYPPNDGFDGYALREQLEVGTRVDRYGNLDGNFVAPEGTPFKNRALPLSSRKKPYNIFEVVAPVEVWSGRAISWFNEPGGGYQFMFDCEIDKLIEEGKLKIVDYTQIFISGLIRSYNRRNVENIIYDVVYQ